MKVPNQLREKLICRDTYSGCISKIVIKLLSNIFGQMTRQQ
jgi:hypothetical protein